MKLVIYLLIGSVLLLNGCLESPQGRSQDAVSDSYLDFSQRDDQLTGGIRMVPISTPSGDFKVWTKRVGNNPSMKLLLLL